MNTLSLKAKGVIPISSQRAILKGWRLRFNVQHFFRHEGGVGNIEYTGDPGDIVLGILHKCIPEALSHLDAAEAYSYGYDRTEVTVELPDAPQASSLAAITYIGMPSFINDQCLPSQRYLNIIVKGATEAGLDKSYIKELSKHPTHKPENYPTFAPPPGVHTEFNTAELTSKPFLTALYGHVFDMSLARKNHEFLKGFFAGKDMTIFHLQRMDSSTQDESMEQIINRQLTQAQQRYINAYLNEYAREYRYAGRYNYQQN